MIIASERYEFIRMTGVRDFRNRQQLPYSLHVSGVIDRTSLWHFDSCHSTISIYVAKKPCRSSLAPGKPHATQGSVQIAGP